VLGIWWRGLTPIGAGAGLIVGGGMSGIAVLITVLGPGLSGWPGALLAEPAAWSVPTSFAVMVLGSLASRKRVPADVGRTMVQLHAPERLRLGQ
jgi:Na+(H+)/acetate symporter ActP